MKISGLLSCVALLSAVGGALNEPVSFTYTYRIVGNSYHPADQTSLYYYKEQLIDQYEALVFGNEEREYPDILKKNIGTFRFDDQCIPAYSNGSLLLVIGNGNGMTIKGNLRRNGCDENVIREKFYIFELFR